MTQPFAYIRARNRESRARLAGLVHRAIGGGPVWGLSFRQGEGPLCKLLNLKDNAFQALLGPVNGPFSSRPLPLQPPPSDAACCMLCTGAEGNRGRRERGEKKARKAPRNPLRVPFPYLDPADAALRLKTAAGRSLRAAVRPVSYDTEA